MKHNILSGIAIFLLISVFSCNENNTGGEVGSDTREIPYIVKSNFNRNRETAAIKSVIKKESESFFNRDYDAWETYWIRKEYSFRAGNGPDSTYAMYGWNNISEHIKNYDHNLYKGKEGSRYKSPLRENFTITFNSEKSAYARWDQYNRITNRDAYYKSEESRLLEKEGDDWKIVNVLAFWDKDKILDSRLVGNRLRD